MEIKKRVRYGEKLLDIGVINEQQLLETLEEQKRTFERIGEILLKNNILSDDIFLKTLSEHLGISYTHLKIEDIDEAVLKSFPLDIIKKHRIIPIKRNKLKIFVAIYSQANIMVLDEIQIKINSMIEPVLILPKEAESILNFLERNNYSISFDLSANKSNDFNDLNKILNKISENDKRDLESEKDEIIDDIGNADSVPVISAVNSIINNAISSGASDIHIEPYDKEIRVRFRIDGVLKTINTLPKNIHNAVVSRVKIMSDLNISEKRLPQDGRFRVKKDGRDIDFRVSVVPMSHGEKIVIRILDKGNLKLDMQELGFEAEELTNFQKALSMPYGIILVTGPTGSGKSTTLYSGLNNLNKDDVNISTAEDPVEYQLKGVNQLACKADIGLDFSAALRSFLRQDPDIIMVGEIRDLETASIAVKAALTGHLVLSTIHTNDSASTVQRLINMGIEPFMLSSSIVLIEAQRLGRRICKRCKTPFVPDKKLINSLDLDYEKYKECTFYKGNGCISCNGTGYSGRVGFYEVMLINDELRDAIAQGRNTEEIRKIARKSGMRTLRENALLKAENGMTTLEEVLRCTI